MKTYFKVTPNYRTGNGYSISIGTGKLYEAKTISSIKIGLEHYFNNHKEKDNNICPLCEVE